ARRRGFRHRRGRGPRVRRPRRGEGSGRRERHRARRGERNSLRGRGGRCAGGGRIPGSLREVRLHFSAGLGPPVSPGAFRRGVPDGAGRASAVIRKSSRRIALLLAVSDVGATCLALVAAYFLRFRVEIVPVTKGVPDAASYYRLLPLIVVLWPIVYYFYGLYQVRRNRSRVEEGLSLLLAPR